MPERPVIDVEAVLKRSRVKLHVFLAMVDQSLPYLGERMSLLRRAINAEEHEDAGKIAHALKGSAASLGMEELREQAAKVEQIAKGLLPGDPAVQVEATEAALRRVVEHIEALKASSCTDAP